MKYKNKNSKILQKYVQHAKERNKLYEKSAQNRADYCLEEFFGGELKFTKVNKLTYQINGTNYYLKFDVNGDYFTLYITEPFIYKCFIKISGLEALGDAALEIDEIVNCNKG